MTTALLTVVLAAGKGTRMRSTTPKVLHRIAGRSMLAHVLDLGRKCGAARQVVVVGRGMEAVAAAAREVVSGVAVHVQAEQLGTAHAVLAAATSIAAHSGDVVVLYADTPLIEAATVTRLREALDGGAAIAVLGFEATDPTGYGRLLTDASGRLVAIREEKDASAEERQVKLCNSGVMMFRVPGLVEMLRRIGNRNAKGEFYLTDVIALARADGHEIAVVRGDEREVLGVNSRDQLALAEAEWQRRARLATMQGGVTMLAPETVWLSHDTVIGEDVTIEPNVFIGPGVTIEPGARICAFSHIVGDDGRVRSGVHIRAGAIIGPFARIRPGSDIGPDVHIGNFVEVKNARLEQGAKANHLAYIGDGRVGAEANIGAGTIFCNYDGIHKHHTDVGAGAFIGSNSALVAPVKIGDRAYIGSGSVITKNVPPDALALTRADTRTVENWSAIMEARRRKAKARDEKAS